MNIDKMTLDECRDYIAACKGWTNRGVTRVFPWIMGAKVSREHPVPDTFSAAFFSLSGAWQWTSITFHGGNVEAIAERYSGAVSRCSVACDMLTGRRTAEAMFRAAAKAWQHERMATKTPIIDPDKVTKESIEALMKDNGLIEEFRAVAAWPVQSKPTNAVPSYPVSQIWTLPTDTYPDGEVYIAAGDWTLWDTMRHIQNITKFTWPEDTHPDPKSATVWRGGNGSVPDARPSWRPTDVPKAEEVAEPASRISPKTIARLRELEAKATQARWANQYHRMHVTTDYWRSYMPIIAQCNTAEDGDLIKEARNHLTAMLDEIERLQAALKTAHDELLRVRTRGHGAAHELDNIAVEAGLGANPQPGAVAAYVRGLQTKAERYVIHSDKGVR